MTTFCTFQKQPPSPRTTFKNAGQENPRTDNAKQKAFEQAITDVLSRFPEAYQAVLDEMRRLEEDRDPAKNKKC